jgi:hypothetical protein
MPKPASVSTRLILFHAELFFPMNLNRLPIIFSATLALLVLLFAGCASNKVNWDTRVGNYTYDQALAEFGPPAKMSMLSDQSKIAEWRTQPRSRMSVGTGIGSAGAGVSAPVAGGGVPALRLTFGPDGILKSWGK